MNQDNKQPQTKAKASVDYRQIFQTLKRYKRTYYKVLPVTFVIACILTLSLPNYYECTVMLSPEINSRRSTSNLASLAASFGVNINGITGNVTEALFPTVYPELMNSTDFKVSLFPVKVKRDKAEDDEEEPEEMTYYDYLADGQKMPWWSTAMKGLFDMILPQKDEKPETVDAFRLTKKQARIVKSLKKKIVCDVDKKTMVITITVTDQDPLICATMADSVQHRLQDFITDYRTKKVKVDLEYNKKLYGEAKSRYEKARRLYAEFVDANHDIILESVRQRQTDLENEMQLQYNIYTQVATSLQQAEMKVQEATPAFTTLQSATVPVKKTGPKRARICLFILFLAFCGVSAWALNKEKQLKPLLGL